VSISGLFGLFFLYEWLDLWRSPWLTAWVAVGYFVSAFALEALFEGSPFCKFICPLGAFNFAYSTASPLRIRAIDPDVCRRCAGKECVNGSSAVAGCGTGLFVPAMRSSLDCTLCLDCARACPHGNVALALERPGLQIERGGWRERPDLGFLAMSLAFMGLANAFGMTPPVYRWLEAVGRAPGTTSTAWPLLAVMGGLELALPAVAAWAAAGAGRALARDETSRRRLLGRFGPSFVPLGLAIWLVHYQFHFLTGALAIVPVAHFFLVDHGLAGGVPDFSRAALVRPGALRALEVWGVAAGFLGSFALAYATGMRVYGTRARALRAAMPWILVLAALAAAASRVFGYPMEVRGISSG
jgi:ferredoxin